MEALTFILQRFYWSLGAGCVINFFFIGNYYILITKASLHEELLFLKDTKNIPEAFFIGTFIIATVIIGFLIEGFNEIGCQYFSEKRYKMYKRKHNPKSKNIYKKLKWRWGLFFFIFREATTIEAEQKIKRAEERKAKKRGEELKPNPIYTFMYPGADRPAGMTIPAWAKYIALKEKSNAVFIFRDLSFMFQLIRTSFLFVSVFSFIAAIVAVILGGFGFFFWWYLAGFGISFLLFFLTTPIATYFGKRYIRDIGSSYNALAKAALDGGGA